MTPQRIRVRMYQVGFGDCFLLTFQYKAPQKPRHVLIDFGTTGVPKGSPTQVLLGIAKDIQRTVGTDPFAIVATHRHADHIAGFDPGKDRKGPGAIIAALKPRCIVQPWTEQPDLARDATAPASFKGMAARRDTLESLHALAAHVVAVDVKRLTRSQGESPLVRELGFIGQNNISNPRAVKNLMTMRQNDYVYAGKATDLQTFLPGVKVEVLGPPTVKQHEGVRKQRQTDDDQFWKFAARANVLATAPESAQPFRHFSQVSGGAAPPWARWVVKGLRQAHGEQQLGLVRALDSAMNNTSVILLFECKGLKLLFPGDAQIENWEYALNQHAILKRLRGVRVYKVGHHGSTNATPKTLWNNWFPQSTKPKAVKQRMVTFMSTKEGKHGSESSGTEVPRTKLVTALKKWTRLQSTQQIGANGSIEEEFVVRSR